MKKTAILVLCLIVFCTAQAQKIGLGGVINHTSTGMLLNYSTALNKRWNCDIGLRYFSKVNLNGNNDIGYSTYQQGYIEHFWERFGLNTRISRKMITYKFFRLDFMANLLLTCESRLDTAPSFGVDPNTGQYIIDHLMIYYKASPGIELSFGPQLYITLSPKVTIQTAVGYGLIYMNYSRIGWSRKYNMPVDGTYQYLVDPFNMNGWKRGDFGGVGFDGTLPMMHLAVQYDISDVHLFKKKK